MAFLRKPPSSSLVARLFGDLLPALVAEGSLAPVSSPSASVLLAPGRAACFSTLDLASSSRRICRIPSVDEVMEFVPSMSRSSNWAGLSVLTAAAALAISECGGDSFLFVEEDRSAEKNKPQASVRRYSTGNGNGNGASGNNNSPPPPPPPPPGMDAAEKARLLELLLQLQNNLSRLLEGKDYDPVKVDQTKKRERVVIVVSDVEETSLLVEALLKEMKSNNANHVIVTLLQKFSADLAAHQKKMLAAAEDEKSWTKKQLEELIGPEATSIMFMFKTFLWDVYEFTKGKVLFALGAAACISNKVTPKEGFTMLVLKFVDAKEDAKMKIQDQQLMAQAVIKFLEDEKLDREARRSEQGGGRPGSS